MTLNVTFHILDALSRDQVSTVTRETEEEEEIELTFEDDDDKKKSYGRADSRKQQRDINIHSIGMTA